MGTKWRGVILLIFLFFCDLPKEAYGFQHILCKEGMSSLIFAKAKMAPTQGKNFAYLEILSFFSWFKCFATQMCNFSDVILGEIIVAVNAQIVLVFYFLSDTIKTKNVFKNRDKNISEIKSSLNMCLRMLLHLAWLLNASRLANSKLILTVEKKGPIWLFIQAMY